MTMRSCGKRAVSLDNKLRCEWGSKKLTIHKQRYCVGPGKEAVVSKHGTEWRPTVFNLKEKYAH